MVYVNESGERIDSPDLSLGYLVETEWIDHPEQKQEGHYEYDENVQTFVVDKEARSAYREITVQTYIPYTAEELEAIKKLDYSKRLDALEDAGYGEQIDKLKSGHAMLTECLLEMSELVYV